MAEIENVGAIRGDLVLDDRQWRVSVAQALRDEGRFTTMFRNLRSSMAGLSLPMGLAGGALSGFAAKAVKAAMGVQESESLFDVSMGRMADSTRAWSEQTAKALGMNANSIRNNVGTFNVMLKSMGIGEDAAAGMSKRLTTLAYDMASFYNLDPAETFLKLSAGLAGETEPLKRLGILINEDAVAAYALKTGLARSKDEMTDAMKTAARFGLIMDRTGLAQGDLARTLGSGTNQMRAAKEQTLALTQSIGRALLPTTTAFFSTVNRGLTLARAFVDQNQELSASFVRAAAGIGLAASALGTLGFVGPYVTRPIWGIARALFSVSVASASAAISLGNMAVRGAWQAGRAFWWMGGAALGAGKSVLMMGATAIPTLRAMGAAFTAMSLRAAGALLPFLPMAAAVTAVAGAFYVLRAVWVQNVGGIQKEAAIFGREVVQYAKAAFTGVYNIAVGTVEVLGQALTGMWGAAKWFYGGMFQIAGTFFGWIYSAVSNTVRALWKVTSTFYGWIIDATKFAFSGVWKTMGLYLDMIWTANKWIVGRIVKAWGDMFGLVKAAASQVAGAVLDAFLWVGEKLFSIMKGYTNFVIGSLMKAATFAKTLASTGSFGEAIKAAGDVSLSKDYLAEVPQMGRDYARLFMEGAGILKENVVGVFGDVTQAVKDQARADFGGLGKLLTPNLGGLQMPDFSLPGMGDAKALLDGLGADGLYEKLSAGAQSMADKLRAAMSMNPQEKMPEEESLASIFSNLGDLSGGMAKKMKDNFGNAAEGVNGLNESLKETQDLMGAKVFNLRTLGSVTGAPKPRQMAATVPPRPMLPGIGQMAPTMGAMAGGGAMMPSGGMPMGGGMAAPSAPAGGGLDMSRLPYGWRNARGRAFLAQEQGIPVTRDMLGYGWNTPGQLNPYSKRTPGALAPYAQNTPGAILARMRSGGSPAAEPGVAASTPTGGDKSGGGMWDRVIGVLERIADNTRNKTATVGGY